jgi:hypothetical protein
VSVLLTERQAAYEAALARLKGKQRAFVEAYVGEAKFNGKAAAITAGYAEKTAVVKASQLLTIVNVSAAIDAAFALRAMPADEVLLRLSKLAAASMEDFLHVEEGREPIDDDDDAGEVDATPRVRRWSLDLDKAAKAGMLDAIQELRPTKFGTAIKIRDPYPALTLLAKHHKLLDEGGILKFLDLSKLTDAQLTRINQGEDPLAVLLDKQPDPA